MTDRTKATCHCGAVELRVEFPDGMRQLMRCNCSLCKRKGAIMAAVPLSKLEVVKGHDALSVYQWNTRVAQHYFCRHCGIYTHHRRRRDPTQYGVNVGCLEGVDPYALGEVPVIDGASMTVADT